MFLEITHSLFLTLPFHKKEEGSIAISVLEPTYLVCNLSTHTSLANQTYYVLQD